MRRLNFPSLVRILAALMAMVAGFMLLSVPVAFLKGETAMAGAFLWPALATLGMSALVLVLPVSPDRFIGPREGFLLATLAWIGISVLGAMPYLLSGRLPGFADAFFETMSGFTTTGATVFTDVEVLPASLLFWRSLTHWLGGMGVIALTVALLPMLGIGGLQLMRAETPGPDVDKLTPKLTSTAKMLWLLYLGFTALQTLLLWLGGMDILEALDHAFATMATGGFSTRNASLGAWDSPWIHGVCTVFMFLAGVNFVLYYRLLRGKVAEVGRNTEFRVYACLALGSSLAMALATVGPVFGGNFGAALEHGSFQVLSILTTTGFMTRDYMLWPALAHGIFLLLMCIGGSAGSTAGGIKVFRVTSLAKLGLHEARRDLHPKGVFTLRFNGGPVRKDLMYPVAAFVAVYLMIILGSTVVLTASGLDLLSALTASLACLGNIGPGLGQVGPACNYAFFSPELKLFLSFLMLLGRLELFTVLVLFMPRFWRR